MSVASVTRSIRFLKKAKEGLSFAITNESAVFKKDSNGYFVIGIDLYEGENKIPYGLSVGGFECSILTSPTGLTWTYKLGYEGHTFSYILTKKSGTSFNTEIPYTINYKGITYNRKISIKTVNDGERGEIGPSLRGPQLWDDCAVGYDFQSGKNGEEYKDVVRYKDVYYSCIESHKKSLTNFPTSDEDVARKYWKVASNFEIIASRIILAEMQLVKNLGVQTVVIKGDTGSFVMMDDKKNILMEMKGGNITCNKGTFKDVDVEGNISASTLHLKLCTPPKDDFDYPVIDGSLIIGYGNYTLPQLKRGESMSVRYIRRMKSRTTEAPSIFKAGGNSAIWDEYTIDRAKTEVKLLYGMYEIIGYGLADKTEWYVTEISNSK